jgi:hypothetical protein
MACGQSVVAFDKNDFTKEETAEFIVHTQSKVQRQEVFIGLKLSNKIKKIMLSL